LYLSLSSSCLYSISQPYPISNFDTSASSVHHESLKHPTTPCRRRQLLDTKTQNGVEVEEEDKPSIVSPKSSVEHDNVNNQVTADESDRMLGGNKKKFKKFLKKKFKKNGGGVLPWKKDPVSIQI